MRRPGRTRPPGTHAQEQRNHDQTPHRTRHRRSRRIDGHGCLCWWWRERRGGRGGRCAAGCRESTVNLFAYAVPKVGYDKLIPAFQATEAGKGVQFQQSYGASGDQSRKVEAGAEADFVNFSVEPDITRLVKAGLVDAGWNANEHNGIPFGSVVTIVVREGNPKGIQDWDDLLKDGVEVVTPEPVQLRARPSGTSSRRTPPRATVARTSRPGSPTSPARRRPREDPAQVGPRGDRGVPPGLR